MKPSKIPWLGAGMVVLALLAACGPETRTTPPAAHGDWGGADDEMHRELVPGLDLWSAERKAAPKWESQPTTPEYLSRAARHREFMQGGVPVEYRHRESPYPATTNAIAQGGALYVRNCVACHDARGLGDGESGRDLTPPPALLSVLISQPRSVDDYLLWSISEGGAQFGSGMPAFKSILTEDDIWQIIIYMRAGFPAVHENG